MRREPQNNSQNCNHGVALKSLRFPRGSGALLNFDVVTETKSRPQIGNFTARDH